MLSLAGEEGGLVSWCMAESAASAASAESAHSSHTSQVLNYLLLAQVVAMNRQTLFLKYIYWTVKGSFYYR